jgi:hypothetical protein
MAARQVTGHMFPASRIRKAEDKARIQFDPQKCEMYLCPRNLWQVDLRLMQCEEEACIPDDEAMPFSQFS